MYFSEMRKSESECIRRTLDQISISHDWDTPDLTCAKSYNDNQIYIITKFPNGPENFQLFFNKKVKKTSREIFNELIGKSKNALNLIKVENIKVNLIDTLNDNNSEYCELFDKALKMNNAGNALNLKNLLNFDVIEETFKNSWILPEMKNFLKYCQVIKSEEEEKNKKRKLLLKELQMDNLPKSLKRKNQEELNSKSKIQRRISDESVHSSSGSFTSRGVEMVRMASVSLSRRNSDKSLDENNQQKISDDKKEKNSLRSNLEKKVFEFTAEENDQKLIAKLMELQIDALKNDKSDLYLVVLSEVTVSAILRYLQGEFISILHIYRVGHKY